MAATSTPALSVSPDDAPGVQARNSAAFWAATGESRRHQVIRGRGYLAVVGDERAGTRVALRSWQVPIMLRQPSAAQAPGLEVVRVRSTTDLAAAERMVITSFELARFEPHRLGEVFPTALIEREGVDVFLALADGRPAGCASPSSPTGSGAITGSAPPQASAAVSSTWYSSA